MRFDLRNHIVRRLPMQIPLRMISKLRVMEGRRFTPNAILERYYKQHLYGDRCLYELPEQPALHILATSVSTGALSVFNRQGLFIQQRGPNSGRSFELIPGHLASIRQVVGASSAFPGLFPPVQITAGDLGVRDGQFPTEFFTDGGVYDNLGLRAFSWLKQHEAPRFDHILVSDAGKPFQILSDAALGFVGQSMRATDILWDRVTQLERENFENQEGFLFLPISEIVDLGDDPTAVHPVVQTEIQAIRTDLDRFSTEEINALAQHGYEVTRKLCRRHGTLGDAPLPDSPPWAPIPTDDLPQPESTTASSHGLAIATSLSRKLRKSCRRRVWSTFFDWREGDGRIIFRFPSKVENPKIRLPDQQLQGIVSRVSEAIEVEGQKRTLFEFEYDLTGLLPGEPVTIEAEILADFPKTARAPMVTHGKTDLISVWLLFPPDRPYRTYDLVSYPVDKSQPARVMNRRYAIDHPYGLLIGWSVVNPEEGRVYECQWKAE